jgi:streptogramin lyase
MTRSTRHRTARPRYRSADRVRARPRLEGLEDRCLLSITEYPMPANSGPFSITAGPDGNLWFIDPGTNSIGTMNLGSHIITEFPIPTANSNPHAITAGPDGNLWFTEYGGNKVGEINPATHAFAEFPVPTASAGLYEITAGPDGNLWFTESSPSVARIGKINPATHAITEFPAGSFAEGITVGPDGNLWFTEPIANKIGRITTTGTITEFSQGLTASAYPWRIGAGPDGNLWFAEHDADKIGMINPTTDAIAEFPIPTANAVPDGIVAGPDGNLWFAEFSASNIGMITTSGTVTEYPIPYANASSDSITAGPDGNLWFADKGTHAIGVVPLNQTSNMHLVVTQQPPASITAGSPFGLIVEAEDSSGNLVSSFGGTVTVGLASNPGGTTLGGTVTVAASGGLATFSGLTLTRAASGYTLYVSGSGPTSTTTSTITVNPGGSPQLVFHTLPSARATAGQPFATQPVLYEVDAYGNLVTGDNSTVITAALASGMGPLQGTTSVTMSGGVATFTNLADNKAETLTLQFTGSGLNSVSSGSIIVSPAAATKLVITTQPPANVVVNTGFGLVAAVEDAYGNVVTSASNSVSVGLANNPTGARLSGTTKVTASQGLATFTGLSLNKVGTGYTLQVSSKGLTSATTSPFNVVSSATSSALAATATTTTPNPLLAPLVLDSPDLWDGLRFKQRSRRV